MHFTIRGKELLDPCDVFVGDNTHGIQRLPSGHFLANAIAPGTTVALALQQFMAQEEAELWDITTCRWIGGQHYNDSTVGNLAEFLVEHHHRLGTVQPARIKGNNVITSGCRIH
jgi:hypothetical protein